MNPSVTQDIEHRPEPPRPARGMHRTPRTAPQPEPAGPWEVALSGDLGERGSDLLETLIELPRRSRGLIWFDSPGGSIYTAMAIAGALRLRGLRATGLVTGECSSAALLPFAACQRRLVVPEATLLFHPARWQSDEDVRLEEAQEWARHFSDLERDYDRLLVGFFGSSAELIREWTRSSRFVRGRELIDAGLAEPLDLFGPDLWSQPVPDTKV